VADAKNTKKDLEVTVYGARHAAPARSCVLPANNRLHCARLPACASPLRAPRRHARMDKPVSSTSSVPGPTPAPGERPD